MAASVRVSVIIPHLNEPDDLRRCLNALEAQRECAPPFEVIVVDNGSDTPPDDVVVDFPGTRLLVQPVPGPGPARNLGVEASSGDIIAFLDADCLPQSKWLKRIVDFFDRNRQVSGLGGSIGIEPAVPDRMTAVEAYEAIFSYRTKQFVERDHFAATGNMAVRRSVFIKVGPFDGIGTHEDKLWGQRARALGYIIAYLPQARVLTPACSDFDSLKKRIDRHVAHCAGEVAPRLWPRIKWVGLAGAMVMSPLAAIPEIARSQEVPVLSNKFQAFGCLIVVRAYRGWRMLRALRAEVIAQTIGSWNRTLASGKKEEG
ncbi:glycosyltransferase family 2 protein [Pelagibacterium sp. H642]|uniref:glycosyltransferase family 2 protein n=1 Tax=Pelagibacterium sp. H642 TaxID=1881069 RepID=UPI0028158FCA|nr:glycosyltransferase family 2 protein [Pelagibacterium sp. H642]WMT92827.1 glycosyltransferase [Pelagibacterium sp. H642]